MKFADMCCKKFRNKVFFHKLQIKNNLPWGE